MLCLQEVDNAADFYIPELAKLGYDVVHQKRPSRLLEKEGLAMAFRKGTLELLASEVVDLSELGRLKASHFGFSNQGMFCMFRHLGTGVVFVCGNCHLHFNAKIDYVRYAQIVFLVERLNSFIEREMESLLTTAKPCVLLCGDFNSGPVSSVMSALHGEPLDLAGRSQGTAASLLDA